MSANRFHCNYKCSYINSAEFHLIFLMTDFARFRIMINLLEIIEYFRYCNHKIHHLFYIQYLVGVGD